MMSHLSTRPEWGSSCTRLYMEPEGPVTICCAARIIQTDCRARTDPRHRGFGQCNNSNRAPVDLRD